MTKIEQKLYKNGLQTQLKMLKNNIDNKYVLHADSPHSPQCKNENRFSERYRT